MILTHLKWNTRCHDIPKSSVQQERGSNDRQHDRPKRSDTRVKFFNNNSYYRYYSFFISLNLDQKFDGLFI